MEQVWAALRQAQQGQGTLLTIEGPAGVGKSHLADRLAALALARGFQAVLATCRSFDGGTPYAPWIAALHALLGIRPADDADARGEAFWRAVDELRLPDEHADPLRGLLGVPARQRTEAPRPRPASEPPSRGRPVCPAGAKGRPGEPGARTKSSTCGSSSGSAPSTPLRAGAAHPRRARG